MFLDNNTMTCWQFGWCLFWFGYLFFFFFCFFFFLLMILLCGGFLFSVMTAWFLGGTTTWFLGGRPRGFLINSLAIFSAISSSVLFGLPGFLVFLIVGKKSFINLDPLVWASSNVGGLFLGGMVVSALVCFCCHRRGQATSVTRLSRGSYVALVLKPTHDVAVTYRLLLRTSLLRRSVDTDLAFYLYLPQK